MSDNNSQPLTSPNFTLKFDFLERARLKLSRKRSKKNQKDMAENTENVAEPTIPSVVVFTKEEMSEFVDDMVSKNTKRSTSTAVNRLENWYKEKYGKELDLNKVGEQEAPQLLKHFFIEIRQTNKENRGNEYEPGTLQTYRNGLRRYFLERPCPPAVDNFDLEKSSEFEFEEVAKILSAKKKDLKKKGLGNKPNAALPVEEDELAKMWSSGAIGRHNPRALLNLVWWNNMTHLGMRAIQEQYDCKIQDFAITEQYIEYNERQTKNRQGDSGATRKRARKYNNKLWRTDGGDRDPYKAFVEYVGHRPKGGNVSSNFFLTPISDKPPKGDVWFKVSPIGRNTLAKQMKIIASTAGLDGKYSNSSGRKTVIQALREDFHPLEICELTGHANPESISSYSHNPLDKQRKMSNQLAGFKTPSSTATAVSDNSSQPASALVEVSTSGVDIDGAGNTANNDGSTAILTRAIGGLFSAVTFNHSTVNVNINLQANHQS